MFPQKELMRGMTTLIKTKTLLHLVSWKKPHYIGISDEGVDTSVLNLEMDEEAWRDMKCPSTITVTVELGDTLNEDAR